MELLSFLAKNFDDEVAGDATEIEGWFFLVSPFLSKLPCAFGYPLKRFAVLFECGFRRRRGPDQVSLSGSHVSIGTGLVSSSLSPWREL